MKIRVSAKGIRRGIIISVISIIMTLSVVVGVLGIDVSRLPEQIILMRKANTVDMYAGHNYYEDYNVNSAADGLAEGYISALGDDYAAYFSASEEKSRIDEVNGKRYGIGITIGKNPDTDMITVIYVSRGGTAVKAGIKQGDVIKQCDGVNVSGKSSNDVVQMISGEDGKEVELTLERSGDEYTVSVKCADFVDDTVSWRVYGGCGVIEIKSFNGTTKKQFDEALSELGKENIKGYIIDLRNNPGGTADTCCEILDELLPKGDLCRTKYKDGSIKTFYQSDDEADDTPLCLLVNKNSASASELFALSVRDFERGVIIGEKTFGKGIMQTTYPLSDGTAIKFTTATIIDKSGETYHKKGIEPDIEVSLDDEKSQRFYFLKDDDDDQLKAAVEYMNKTAE